MNPQNTNSTGGQWQPPPLGQTPQSDPYGMNAQAQPVDWMQRPDASSVWPVASPVQAPNPPQYQSPQYQVSPSQAGTQQAYYQAAPQPAPSQTTAPVPVANPWPQQAPASPVQQPAVPFDVDAAIRANAQAPVPASQRRRAVAPSVSASTNTNTNTSISTSMSTTAGTSGATARKGKGILLSLFLAFILIGGGGAAYVFIIMPDIRQSSGQQQAQNISSDDAQAVFIAMLAKSMQVKTFSRTITAESQLAGGGGILRQVFTAESDFSDASRPKSKIAVNVTQQTGSGQTERTADFIGDGEAAYFRLKTIASQPADEQLQKLLESLGGQWLILDDTEKSAKLLQQSILTDPSQLSAINQLSNELIIGNIDETTQEDALTFAFLQQLYTIQSFQPATVDGERTIQYQVRVDSEKLVNYASIVGVEPGSTVPEGPIDMTLHVAVATGLPLRIETTRGPATVRIDYSNFGQQLTIQAPPSARAQ